jgi:hypothetical protein
MHRGVWTVGSWADLGQCKLLLGDLGGAEAAYQRFKELSDRSAIRSAHGVLMSICRSLQARGDQKAVVVQMAIDKILQPAL